MAAAIVMQPLMTKQCQIIKKALPRKPVSDRRRAGIGSNLIFPAEIQGKLFLK